MDTILRIRLRQQVVFLAIAFFFGLLSNVLLSAAPWKWELDCSATALGVECSISESFLATKSGEKYYRYVSEGEADVIRRTGRIPNVDRAGSPKKVYITNRKYETAGKAKTHNQMPKKPSYRVEIDPENVKNRTPFTRVNPSDNPKWGLGGGVEATTMDAIPVDPNKLVKLKGTPK